LYSAYIKKTDANNDFKASLYNIVWGQCSDALQTRIESHPDHAASRQDGLALLVIIKKVTHTFEEQRKTNEALCELKENFYTYQQKPGMTLKRFYEGFLDLLEVLKSVEAHIVDDGPLREVPLKWSEGGGVTLSFDTCMHKLAEKC
jgi:hypothetical protein